MSNGAVQEKLTAHGSLLKAQKLTVLNREPIIILMPLGLYIAVPFCRTKCTYCNFASDVFSRTVFDNYIKRLGAEIEHSTRNAEQMGALLEPSVDSIYFGGGTPTLLEISQLERVFVTIRQIFTVEKDAEITVECAPGTLSSEMLDALVCCGVNRVSLGVQSFIDKEAASVGRLHKSQTVLDDIARLRTAGITNINVDLIAGLPHQTRDSWEHSLDQLISAEVPHASVYMLEVDEDSRLGRELIAGGQKYHAHFVPDEDLTADLYEIAALQRTHPGRLPGDKDRSVRAQKGLRAAHFDGRVLGKNGIVFEQIDVTALAAADGGERLVQDELLAGQRSRRQV